MIRRREKTGELIIFGTSKEILGAVSVGTGTNRVDLSKDITTLEAKAKELGDKILSPRGLQCYFHLISKVPLEIAAWVGDSKTTPDENWWKPFVG